MAKKKYKIEYKNKQIVDDMFELSDVYVDGKNANHQPKKKIKSR